MTPLEIFRDMYFKDANITKHLVSAVCKEYAGILETQFFYIDNKETPSFAYHNYKPKIKPSQLELVKGYLQNKEFFEAYTGDPLEWKQGFIENIKPSYKDGAIDLGYIRRGEPLDITIDDYIKQHVDKTEDTNYKDFTQTDRDFALVMRYVLDHPLQTKKLGNCTLIGIPEFSACKHGYMFLIFDK